MSSYPGKKDLSKLFLKKTILTLFFFHLTVATQQFQISSFYILDLYTYILTQKEKELKEYKNINIYTNGVSVNQNQKQEGDNFLFTQIYIYIC